jgi:ribosomal protein S12 methylthiotransferase RimO
MSDRTVAVVRLGCARNDVDSEEIAGRLTAAGWQVVPDPADAAVAVVNTCAFVESAKRDSIDTLLDVADLKDDGAARTRAVVAVGCLAERYGRDLASELTEVDAVLGFDGYADLAAHLRTVLDGGAVASHVPVDRRTLLPISPVARPAAARPPVPEDPVRGPASGPPQLRTRLDDRPWAPLKLASGCDRRCSFCAIPAFRGAFVSRPADEVLAEARWLAGQGVRELFCVSENTTSYGKDLGDLRALEALLPRLAAVDGIDRVRLSYLQPAEVRPGLVEAITGTAGVAAYFDLSFQHASPAVLRRMRRFGGTEPFLDLVARIRARRPDAGIRSNVIVGFPGETEADVAELRAFLEAARLDVVGVFGYSDEDGTEAAGLAGHLPADEVAARVAAVSSLVDELMTQRAEDREGEGVRVLVDEAGPDGTLGRADHQGPDDAATRLVAAPGAHAVGDLVEAVVTGGDGPDLVARPVAASPPRQTPGRPEARSAVPVAVTR